MESAFGKTGRVTVPISADRPGEVLIEIRGGSEAFTALSDQAPIPKGARVLVVECPSARSVVVVPY
jgi:hypothetical protein